MEDCMINPPDEPWFPGCEDEEYPEPEYCCFCCGALCFGDFCDDCVAREGN